MNQAPPLAYLMRSNCGFREHFALHFALQKLTATERMLYYQDLRGRVQVLFSAPGAWLLTRFSLHGLQTPSRMVCQSGPIPGQRLLDYGQITTVLRTAPGLR